MRWAASSPDMPSRPAITSKVSSMSASESFTATAPRFGSSSTSPSAASILIASRKRRARDLQLLAQRALVELGARRDRAFDDELAQPGASLLVQHAARGMAMTSAIMVSRFCMQKQSDYAADRCRGSAA